jgi:hypothetical protein
VFPGRRGGPLRWNAFYKRHFKPAVYAGLCTPGQRWALGQMTSAEYEDATGEAPDPALAIEQADVAAGHHLHRLRFHDLRHTRASLLAAKGAHPKAIQQQLGHSSITITLDRYTHLFPSETEALAERLDATFAEAEVAELAAVGEVVELR